LLDMLMKEQPESITLIGLCTDICVVSNAMLVRAGLHETPIRVVAAACAGTTPENHDHALAVMKSCQIEIL
ncbi:MAG: isochorismatase family protein, partial [Solobacterium sp.]|nr:isochorismatase family protein [Solobacterium sp.]